MNPLLIKEKRRRRDKGVDKKGPRGMAITMNEDGVISLERSPTKNP